MSDIKILDFLEETEQGKHYKALWRGRNILLVKKKVSSGKVPLIDSAVSACLSGGSEMTITKKYISTETKKKCNLFTLCLYKSIIDKDTAYYFYEYKRGETLRNYVLSKSKDGKEFSKDFYIAKKMCECVAFIHGLGLIHANINPESFYVQYRAKTSKESPSVRLFSFGYSRTIKKSAITEPQTPKVSAPELSFTKSSDIWSLGKCFQFLFSSNGKREILPISLRNFLEKMTGINPKKRPQALDVIEFFGNI